MVLVIMISFKTHILTGFNLINDKKLRKPVQGKKVKKKYKNVTKIINNDLNDIQQEHDAQVALHIRVMRDARIKQAEEEKQRQLALQQAQLAEQKRQQEAQIASQQQEINIICTAYTADPSENGNNLGITAYGTRLRNGICAIPRNLKLGTKIHIQGLTQFIGTDDLSGEDYGNPKYICPLDSNTIRIDVFMDSKDDALNFGVKEFKGYIIK
jgi:3D (Asp-Asp-Asp) domain-containing protein